MLRYFSRRVLIMIPLLLLVSVVTFIIIQLPPGDYVDTYVQNLARSGAVLDQSIIDSMKKRYALDKPLFVQYFVWIGRILTRADFGNSFAFSRPVSDVLWERVPRTMGIAFAGIALAWVIAVPIGIYSAVHQYSFLDYLFTFLRFIGLSIPAFLFAIVLVFIIYLNTGWAVTGIFSPEFEKAAWSLPKLFDMLKNLSVPLLVLSSSGAAG